MLEHPEIGWIERTGYPSWLQERGAEITRRKDYGKIEAPMGIGLLAAARGNQQLCEAMLSAPTAAGKQAVDLPSG